MNYIIIYNIKCNIKYYFSYKKSLDIEINKNDNIIKRKKDSNYKIFIIK